MMRIHDLTRKWLPTYLPTCPPTCLPRDLWDTDYNWELINLKFMTNSVTWQLKEWHWKAFTMFNEDDEEDKRYLVIKVVRWWKLSNTYLVITGQKGTFVVWLPTNVRKCEFQLQFFQTMLIRQRTEGNVELISTLSFRQRTERTRSKSILHCLEAKLFQKSDIVRWQYIFI